MCLRTISTMRLEKIEATASRDYVKLCFDDESTMRIPVSVVTDLALYAPMKLSETDMERLHDAAGRASAKLRAVRIIAASGVSEKELRRRLVQKGEKAEYADEAVQWLTDLNLVNDSDAATQIVRKGISKGYGKARIKQMLYEKGIERALWEDALSALPDMDETIDRYLSAHMTGREPDQKQIKKITDALLRRGHSWEDIRAGLSRWRVSIKEDEYGI